MVSELRRFQLRTGVMLAAALGAVTAVLLLLGHASAVSGLLAGGMLGLVNLTWMVSSATRLMGQTISARGIQAVAFIRFLLVALLLGVILIVGHVNPVGAVIGYGLFPVAAAASGCQLLRRSGVPS